MTHRTAKNLGASGVGVAACAFMIAMLELAGLVAGISASEQLSLYTALIALAMTLLGSSWMHFAYGKASSLSISQVQTAFKAGVDYGQIRHRRLSLMNNTSSFDNRFDDAA